MLLDLSSLCLRSQLDLQLAGDRITNTPSKVTILHDQQQICHSMAIPIINSSYKLSRSAFPSMVLYCILVSPPGRMHAATPAPLLTRHPSPLRMAEFSLSTTPQSGAPARAQAPGTVDRHGLQVPGPGRSEQFVAQLGHWGHGRTTPPKRQTRLSSSEGDVGPRSTSFDDSHRRWPDVSPFPLWLPGNFPMQPSSSVPWFVGCVLCTVIPYW